MNTACQLAAIYGIAALGVLLTAVVIEFFDLTVDGSFTLGAAAAATVLRSGGAPWIALVVAGVCGLLAGSVTATLWKAGIQPLLAGILVMFALYSINLHIMSASNVSLYDQPQLFYSHTTLVLALCCSIVALLVWFLLLTPGGTAMRASARSVPFLQGVGISPALPIIAALLISNALVAVAGATMAQLQRYADISMGEGTLVSSLAAIILGRALSRQNRRPGALVLAGLLGSLAYQIVLFGALRAGLPPVEFRLLTSVIVVTVLLLPTITQRAHARRRIAKSL